MFAKIKNTKMSRVLSFMMVFCVICAMFAMPTYAASADDFTATTVAENTNTNFVMPRASGSTTLSADQAWVSASKYYSAGTTITLSASWNRYGEVALGILDSSGSGDAIGFTGYSGSISITINASGYYRMTIINMSGVTQSVSYSY